MINTNSCMCVSVQVGSIQTGIPSTGCAGTWTAFSKCFCHVVIKLQVLSCVRAIILQCSGTGWTQTICVSGHFSGARLKYGICNQENNFISCAKINFVNFLLCTWLLIKNSCFATSTRMLYLLTCFCESLWNLESQILFIDWNKVSQSSVSLQFPRNFPMRAVQTQLDR